MHFEAKKVIVVGGSAGMGRQVAADVVDHGGSAVIVGRSKARVDDTVTYLLSDQASWVTGAILNVDGGIMTGRN
jgi:NAD(P)-dependent dehydrogenase (short-subunit alcohol dehydrogenase family)